jgi:hypothetical protein
MEQQNQDSTIFKLNIEPSILEYLSETARWGKFLSILGFIMCGILLLAGIIIPPMLSRVSVPMMGGQARMMAGMSVGVMIFLYLIIAVIYFFPCLYLFLFSRDMKLAIASEDQFKLTESFKNLKKMFKYIGILTIVFLSFYVLILGIAVIAGISR